MGTERARRSLRYVVELIRSSSKGFAVNDNDNEKRKETSAKDCPPPVMSAPPERELERKLKRHPDDLDAKADVGSDESMDASDPPAAAQPGSSDEPAPSSGFPESNRD